MADIDAAEIQRLRSTLDEADARAAAQDIVPLVHMQTSGVRALLDALEAAWRERAEQRVTKADLYQLQAMLDELRDMSCPRCVVAERERHGLRAAVEVAREALSTIEMLAGSHTTSKGAPVAPGSFPDIYQRARDALAKMKAGER